MVVGNRVIESAAQVAEGDLLAAAESIGSAAVVVGRTAERVGQFAGDLTMQLTGIALATVKRSVEEGAKLATAVGNFIADQATAIGNEVAKVGPLVAGLAEDTWNEMKQFLDCLKPSLSLCAILIGRHCDCGAGSYVEVESDRLEMRCVFLKVSEFTNGFGIKAQASQDINGNSESGTAILPGEEYEQAYEMLGQALKSRDEALNELESPAPAGSCETSLHLAVDGVAQFGPDIKATVHSNGNTHFEIKGLVRASVDTIVTAEGSCGFFAERSFPRQPKTQVFCAGKFCIIIALQMIAQLEIQGVLTGTVEMSHDVDFEIYATVDVTKGGHSEVHVTSPKIEFKNSEAIAASATASVRVGAGPKLTVWPIPGVPVTFNPMAHAEAKAQGTVGVAESLLQESSQLSSEANTSSSIVEATATTPKLKLCNAAAISIYTDFGITGFALPPELRAYFSDDILRRAIETAMEQGARAMIKMMAGPLQCLPGASEVSDTILAAATRASGAITALIPGLGLNFNFKSISLLDPFKMFCEEVWTSPDPGFGKVPCAADLGCKHAGRGPPSESEIEVVEPQQIEEESEPVVSSTDSACYNIPMGDRFIQIGKFRIADMDGETLVISHKDTKNVAARYLKSGNAHQAGSTLDPWDRTAGTAKGIKFGYEFIQIGDFRFGAVDEDEFSVASTTGSRTIQTVRRSDGHNSIGANTLDRAEGPATGITSGDKFLQIGKFRFVEDGGDKLLLFWMGATPPKALQRFNSDGTVNWHSTGAPAISGAVMPDRASNPSKCRDVAEMAHGLCRKSFGTWGDRFIQLGKWRLAALDDDSFVFAHDITENVVFTRDGRKFWGYSNEVWRRLPGFPYGITFGPDLIQIGNWRLYADDDEHLSLSHARQGKYWLFKRGGTVERGENSNAWNGWKGTRSASAGPAAGVGYGDQFLQIRNFRIGAADGGHRLLVTHIGTDDTIEGYTDLGETEADVLQTYTDDVNDRIAQWHCGGIQTILHSCPGITTGDRFLQLGDWRIAAMDSDHLSVSHREGKTAQVFKSDGSILTGSRTTHNSWQREAKEMPAYDYYKQVKFGNRFIELGDFRIGEIDNKLSVSHRNRQSIRVFQSDGTLLPTSTSSYGLWGLPVGPPIGVTFGDRFVQIGQFRLGDVDGTHFSVAHVQRTLQVYKSDGNLETDIGTDNNTHTTARRSLLECRVVPETPRPFKIGSTVVIYSERGGGFLLQMCPSCTVLLKALRPRS
ncbi:unnamed protein product [Symbiodinium sp. CCMP2592]|nr:unnamed protein product [Symbiodinium sp. CCMP2592]